LAGDDHISIRRLKAVHGADPPEREESTGRRRWASAFELVALVSVGASAETSPGLHEGIGRAYGENASGYRVAARGPAWPVLDDCSTTVGVSATLVVARRAVAFCAS
jgi:hypothetical protein